MSMTIFLFDYVKSQEKMKGKNKLVPRLLGINKESVLRVDEKTKQVFLPLLFYFICFKTISRKLI